MKLTISLFSAIIGAAAVTGHSVMAEAPAACPFGMEFNYWLTTMTVNKETQNAQNARSFVYENRVQTDATVAASVEFLRSMQASLAVLVRFRQVYPDDVTCTSTNQTKGYAQIQIRLQDFDDRIRQIQDEMHNFKPLDGSVSAERTRADLSDPAIPDLSSRTDWLL